MEHVTDNFDTSAVASAASSPREGRKIRKSALKFGSCLGAAFVLVAGLGVAAAPAASAADREMITLDRLFPWEDAAGWMGFSSNGDVVTVCDTDADGQFAVLHVYNKELYWSDRYTIRAKGEGECTTRKASMGSPFNLRESKTFGFLLCAGTKSTPDGAYCDGANWLNKN